MLAALGLFVFERATIPFSDRSRRTDFRHAKSQRVGARDASQFVGPGDDSLSIGGCVVPEGGGSFASIETLRDMAATGEVYPFVEGTGRVLGNFVIVGLDERAGYLMDDGRPRKVDFTLDLSRVD